MRLHGVVVRNTGFGQQAASHGDALVQREFLIRWFLFGGVVVLVDDVFECFGEILVDGFAVHDGGCGGSCGGRSEGFCIGRKRKTSGCMLGC
jgi:hypothetical protein